MTPVCCGTIGAEYITTRDMHTVFMFSEIKYKSYVAGEIHTICGCHSTKTKLSNFAVSFIQSLLGASGDFVKIYFKD